MTMYVSSSLGLLPRGVIAAGLALLLSLVAGGCIGGEEGAIEDLELEGGFSGADLVPIDPEAAHWTGTTTCATHVYAFDDSLWWLSSVGTLPRGEVVGVWGIDRDDTWAQVSPRGLFVRLRHVALDEETDLSIPPPPIGGGRLLEETTTYRIASSGRRYAAGTAAASSRIDVYGVAGESSRGLVVSSPDLVIVALDAVELDEAMDL